MLCFGRRLPGGCGGVCGLLLARLLASALSPDSDERLSAPELISKYGYPAETHTVTTADGYILTLHRIAGKASAQPGVAPSPHPLLLQHGLFCSSADWVVTGPGHALAYLLADAGFDVWLGNARGNTYSRQHRLALPPARYWDFSWHEMGVYDLPAVIDYILEQTGQQELYYVGHSMGATMFFVMASERPQYNGKIRAAALLAPVAFLGHLRGGGMRLLASFGNELGAALGYGEFLPSGRMFLGHALCAQTAPTQRLCANVLFFITGYNPQHLNQTQLPAILAHTPAGASTRTLVHYAQLIRSGRFCGMVRSPDQPPPPDYPLERVTAPVALFTADNDNLCSEQHPALCCALPQDVAALQARLSHVIGRFRVSSSAFNHLDFMWATDSRRLLYEPVIRVLTRAGQR